MNRNEKAALDRHITGNYGEDQLSTSPIDELIEAAKILIEARNTWGEALIPAHLYDELETALENVEEQE